MKTAPTPRSPFRLFGRSALVLTLSWTIALSISVQPASAITRSAVLSRASHWVKKRIPYSQRGYYRGYRRDCSGFVSMAWGLKTSYTTRSIGSVARRIPMRRLRPGDAILVRGRHVALFGGWVGRSRTKYIAIEEYRRGRPATRHVRRIPRGAIAIRYRGLREVKPAPRRTFVRYRLPSIVRPRPKRVLHARPAFVPTVSMAATASLIASPSVVASPSAVATPYPSLP